MALNLLITGASGLLGQRVVSRLADHPDVGKIWTLDVKPGAVAHPKIRVQEHDISKPWPKPPFKLDAVMHFAFALNPMKDLEREKQINLQGTEAFLEFLEKQKPTWALTISSGTAYGALADNPALLKEEDPLRAAPSFPYAYHKRLMEDRVWEWKSKHQPTALAVLRPCILMSPEVDNYISRTLGKKIPPAVLGVDPPMQFVHTEDVARACVHLMANSLGGAYNVAGEGTLTYIETLKLAGGVALKMPKALVPAVADLAWKGGVLEGPPGMADFLMYPWVMDTSHLRDTGFSFLYNSREALNSWLAAQLRWDRRPVI